MSVYGAQVFVEGVEIIHGNRPFIPMNVVELRNVQSGSYSFPLNPSHGQIVLVQARAGATTNVVDCGHGGNMVSYTVSLRSSGGTGYIDIAGSNANWSTPLTIVVTAFWGRF